MNINRKEVLRYLGIRGMNPDTILSGEIDKVESEILSSSEPHSVYRELDIALNDGIIGIDDFEVESKALYRNLSGCKKAVLFAATIGRGADIIVKKYELSNIVRAAIAQAVGAAVIEAYCDELNEKIRREYEGRFNLKPRFSPGYGDFSLEHQRDFFRVLDIERSVGISLNESLLMVPTKSVTAIIGLSSEGKAEEHKKCYSCDKSDCIYRL